MSWRNIQLIFLREVRDQLRDRRTLFMIAILPLLLYPALGIGMVQMTVLFSEQPRTVVVLGEEYLPPQPQLLDGDRIVSNWFQIPADAEKLQIVGDHPKRFSEHGEDPVHEALLEKAREIERKLVKRDQMIEQLPTAKAEGDHEEVVRLEHEIAFVRAQLAKLFSQSRIQVLILIPQDFGENIQRMNELLKAHRKGRAQIEDYPRPTLVQNSADEKSMIAYLRVKEAIDAWEQEILRYRLKIADLPATLPMPVNPAPVDLAEEHQLSANLWSKLFPALLVIMAVTGAFYPAIDLGAGEKERGTMETLLICPASRTEIVLGKFLTVILFSISTVLLNLLSMGLTGKYMVSLAGGATISRMDDLGLPSWPAMIWLVVLLIPLAALFSALCLSLATFARSSKEGQYYLTPLLMVTLGLTVFCLSPAVEITPFYSVMPVVGVALLLKALLLSPLNAAELYWYAIPVLVTSIGYSLLALWWAIDQFNREEVLFREAERFELRLWIRHLLRDKEPIPSFAEAGLCFVMIMFLQFAALKYMRQAILHSTEQTLDTLMLQLLMVQQLVIIASPALFMGVLLTTDIARTFRLRWPQWRMLGAAAILPFVLHPLSLELAIQMQWFFPPLPASITETLRVMTDSQQPLWFILLAFAVAPAVCEEIAFRGFILSGFSHSGRVGLAIGLSSLTFGIMHMIPQQVFNATLLGLVLGLIAVRSGSLLPCILFHFLYNSLGVLHGRVDLGRFEGTALDWFVRSGEELRYQWPLLVLCAIIAIPLLRWLLLHKTPESNSPEQMDSFSPQNERQPFDSGSPHQSQIGVS